MRSAATTQTTLPAARSASTGNDRNKHRLQRSFSWLFVSPFRVCPVPFAENEADAKQDAFYYNPFAGKIKACRGCEHISARDPSRRKDLNLSLPLRKDCDLNTARLPFRQLESIKSPFDFVPRSTKSPFDFMPQPTKSPLIFSCFHAILELGT